MSCLPAVTLFSSAVIALVSSLKWLLILSSLSPNSERSDFNSVSTAAMSAILVATACSDVEDFFTLCWSTCALGKKNHSFVVSDVDILKKSGFLSIFRGIERDFMHGWKRFYALSVASSCWWKLQTYLAPSCKKGKSVTNTQHWLNPRETSHAILLMETPFFFYNVRLNYPSIL